MHNIEHKTIDLVILTDFGCSVEPAGNVRCYRVLRDVKRWPKVAQLQDNFRFINLKNSQVLKIVQCNYLPKIAVTA